MEIEGDRVQVVVEDRNGPKPPSGGEPEDNYFKETLIDAVREKPALWDPEDPGYKNAKSKPAMWVGVARTLNEAFGTTVNGESVQSTWKNLKDSFARIERRRKNSTGLAAGEEPESWPHFASMLFLRAKTSSNTERISTLTFTPSRTSSLAVAQKRKLQTEQLLRPSSTSSASDAGPSTPPTASLSEDSIWNVDKPKRKIGKQNALNALAEKWLKEDLNEKIDDWDSFGTHVASSLRVLNKTSPRLAATTQTKLQKALLEAQEELASLL